MPRVPFLRIVFSLLFMLVVILSTFWPVLNNSFVNFDDPMEIADNPDLQAPVTLEKLKWNWTHTRLTLYMPVTYYAWGAVAAVATPDRSGRPQPQAFHAFNLTLHCVCAALVFLLIFQMFRRIGPALIGSLIFALHPLAVEPVAWASGMYTLLSAAFSLCALIAYISFVRSTPSKPVDANLKSHFTSRTAVLFSLATLLYAIALLTKAASASLPLAAAVIDLYLLKRPTKKVVQSLWIWLLMAMPVIWFAKRFQDLSSITIPPLWVRPFVALYSMGFYCRKLLFPVGLIPDYGRTPAWVLHHAGLVSFSVGGAICVLLCAWFARRSMKWVTAGIGVMVAGIGPYLGLTAFDFQYISTVADRYFYFGLVGVGIITAGICMQSRVATVLFAGVILFFCFQSNAQTRIWKDTYTLFDYTREVNHQSLLSHSVFGFTAAREGRTDAAEDEYKKALEIWPEDAEIRFNLGNLYSKRHLDLACEQYRLAVQYHPSSALYRNNYALSLIRLNRINDAIIQLNQAIAMSPDDIDARNILGDYFSGTGKRDQAAEQYHMVLAIDPNNAHAQAGLNALFSGDSR